MHPTWAIQNNSVQDGEHKSGLFLVVCLFVDFVFGFFLALLSHSNPWVFRYKHGLHAWSSLYLEESRPDQTTQIPHTEEICIAASCGRAEKRRRHVFFQKTFYSSSSIPLWRKKESDLAAWEHPMDSQALRQLPQMIFPFSSSLLRFD